MIKSYHLIMNLTMNELSQEELRTFIGILNILENINSISRKMLVKLYKPFVNMVVWINLLHKTSW